MKVIKLKRNSVQKIGEFNSNQNGFIIISFIALVPFLLAGIFAFASVIQLSNIKTNLETKCLGVQNQSFHRQRQRLVKLLKLNPKASRLSLEKIQVKAKMAAALALGQLELLAILEIKLNKILIQQEKLDLEQRLILNQAQEEFVRSELSILKDLHRLQNQIIKRNPPLWILSFEKPNPGRPRLAVRANGTDIAPTYDLQVNFQNEQLWRIHWIMKIQSGLRMISFLKFNLEVNQECALTLQQNNEDFSIIAPDKS
ncbi:MAG: hypothetical protein AABY64_07530 [Bdellovibrionota bacterium]